METVHQDLGKYKIQRQCPICRKAYTARKKALEHGKETTCSRSCSYTLRSRNRESRITLNCALCKKEFSRYPAQIKGKHGSNFCSPRCHYDGRSLGLSRRVVYKPYNYTKQGLANLSKTGARVYASGKGLDFPKTELAVVEALKNRSIKFTHQMVVDFPDRAYVVDFFFPSRNLIIELDSPGCHKRRAMHADFERDELLSGLGFEVIRLWDNGIPENAVRAVFLTLFQGG